MRQFLLDLLAGLVIAVAGARYPTKTGDEDAQIPNELRPWQNNGASPILSLVKQLQREDAGTGKSVIQNLKVFSTPQQMGWNRRTYHPGIMSAHVHHRVTVGSDGDDERQNLSGRFQQRFLAGVGAFHESSL